MTFQQQEQNLKRLKEAGKQLTGEELPRTYNVTKDEQTVMADFRRETRNRKRTLNYLKKKGA